MKNKNFILFFGLLFLIVFFLSPVEALKVKGSLVNKTNVSNLPENITVFLVMYKGTKEVKKYKAKTDNKGRFIFKNIEINDIEKYGCLIIARYKNVAYFSDWLDLSNAAASVTIEEISVYETSTDKEGIVIESRHIVIDIEEESLFVVERIVVKNLSNKSYIGRSIGYKKRKVINFVLAEGFTQLELITGVAENYVFKTSDGILDVRPIKPGKRSMSFSYKIPYERDKDLITIPITATTEKFDLMVQDAIMHFSIKNEKVPVRKMENIGGKTYHHLVYSYFPEDSKLDLLLFKIKKINVYFKWGSFILIFVLFSINLLYRKLNL